MTDAQNPLGLRGLAFVEFADADPARLHALFNFFGFSKVASHASLAVSHFQQGEISFLLNTAEGTFAEAFFQAHGPSICALGLKVDDPHLAFEEAVRRGARPFTPTDGKVAVDQPAIYGIGDSLMYFVPANAEGLGVPGFAALEQPEQIPSRGFTRLDHLTNNVYKGTLETWADYYKNIFGFTEVRHFDIRGEQTGLYSFALRSPCGTFCIPINEGKEEKSQIEEYLREYKGPGVQHIALLSDDLLASLDAMEANPSAEPVRFLDIDDEYYEEVFERVPGVTESPARIKHHQVLVDGDEEGYLLQIFTQNLMGPIFFELIQRKNHLSFGEGNFGALFRSIERDQARRGVL